jgi:DNA-binding GntR family transcriptional regulator
MARPAPQLQVIRPDAAPTRRRQGTASRAAAPRKAEAAVTAEAAPTSTLRIVESITTAIVERRLMPGTKLAEQKIADIFKVSRTVVRQALNQLSRHKLVTLEPARGARVAEPSIEEARQVFEVRHMLESAVVRRLAASITPQQVAALSRPRCAGSTCRAAPACWPTSTRCSPR